jgi:hypothetical protein
MMFFTFVVAWPMLVGFESFNREVYTLLQIIKLRIVNRIKKGKRYAESGDITTENECEIIP